MTIGAIEYSPRIVFKDERTGREVWKVTGWDDCHCVATYMYCQAFSGDEKYLAFAANRTGRYEIYRLDLASGETVQLTDYKDSALDDWPLVYSNFHPNGRELVFDDGLSLRAIDIETLEQREVARRPAAWTYSGSTPQFSRDGKFAIGGFHDAEGRFGIAGADFSGGKLADFYRWPHPDVSISHLLAVPTDDLMLTFCPAPDRQNDPAETPANRARAWKLDAASGVAAPFLIMPPGFRATHEFWGADGRLYFHRKTVPSWTPASLCSLSVGGDDLRQHYLSDRKLGHSCLSRDGRHLVSDVQDPTGNELIHIDLSSGKDEIVCWPDSSVASGDVQVGHVHPSFSPSGSKLVFTSDKSGHAAVYVAPMD